MAASANKTPAVVTDREVETEELLAQGQWDSPDFLGRNYGNFPPKQTKREKLYCYLCTGVLGGHICPRRQRLRKPWTATGLSSDNAHAVPLSAVSLKMQRSPDKQFRRSKERLASQRTGEEQHRRDSTSSLPQQSRARPVSARKKIDYKRIKDSISRAIVNGKEEKVLRIINNQTLCTLARVVVGDCLADVSPRCQGLVLKVLDSLSQYASFEIKDLGRKETVCRYMKKIIKKKHAEKALEKGLHAVAAKMESIFEETSKQLRSCSTSELRSNEDRIVGGTYVPDGEETNDEEDMDLTEDSSSDENTVEEHIEGVNERLADSCSVHSDPAVQQGCVDDDDEIPRLSPSGKRLRDKNGSEEEEPSSKRLSPAEALLRRVERSSSPSSSSSCSSSSSFSSSVSLAVAPSSARGHRSPLNADETQEGGGGVRDTISRPNEGRIGGAGASSLLVSRDSDTTVREPMMLEEDMAGQLIPAAVTLTYKLDAAIQKRSLEECQAAAEKIRRLLIVMDVPVGLTSAEKDAIPSTKDHPLLQNGLLKVFSRRIAELRSHIQSRSWDSVRRALECIYQLLKMWARAHLC